VGPVRRTAGVVALVLTAGVSACSGPDTSSVPTEAHAPYLCDGVPRRGAELILGGAAALEGQDGSWGAGRYSCRVRRDDDRGALIVSAQDVASAGNWGSTPDVVLRTLSEQGSPTPIEADAPGAGYGFGGGSAGWVCEDRFVLISLVDVSVEGRDGQADAEAYLVSMLPWACGDQDPPRAEPAEA